MPRASSRSVSTALPTSVTRPWSISWVCRGSVAAIACAVTQLQFQPYQVLLCAVVQVALDPAPLGVLGRDEALAGYRQFLQPLAELGGEALVLEDEPRLVRQVVDQPGLGRRDVLAFHHRDRAQQLV